jgi:hypothetical protein
MSINLRILKLSFASYSIRDPIRHLSLGTSTRDDLTADKVVTHSVEVRILQLHPQFDDDENIIETE